MAGANSNSSDSPAAPTEPDRGRGIAVGLVLRRRGGGELVDTVG